MTESISVNIVFWREKSIAIFNFRRARNLLLELKEKEIDAFVELFKLQSNDIKLGGHGIWKLQKKNR